jgi:DNA-binding PadR family transcriptional regulator
MAERGYLGEFELVIMLALIRLDEPAYGIPIAAEIEKYTGRSILLGSLYAALERLQEKGLVTSELGEPTPERGGRARRYFTPTRKGRRRVAETRAALTRLWRRIPLLKGERA